MLPKEINKVIVPPIKCQGIKTKLVPFIASSVNWDGEGRWIEPFLGSGVVAFNIQPQRAILADSNTHIIQYYQDIQNGVVTPNLMKEYLTEQGRILSELGEEHYYAIRADFNESPNSFRFTFLNRACFNGIMRFNSKGGYNVPFCRKPERYQQALVTKICNQIDKVSEYILNNDVVFQVNQWDQTLALAEVNDFVYLDPPYIGRHADYFNKWEQEEASGLVTLCNQLPCGFALSMWYENKYRKNDHVDEWDGNTIVFQEHFYHVGSTEKLRNSMTECLIMNHEATVNIPNQELVLIGHL